MLDQQAMVVGDVGGCFNGPAVKNKSMMLNNKKER